MFFPISQAVGKSKIYNLQSEDVMNALNSIKLGLVSRNIKLFELNGLGLNGFKTNKLQTLNAEILEH